MDIRIIKNEAQYNEALDRVDELLDRKVEKNTPLGDELELLLMVIKDYEDKFYSVQIPNPIDVLRLKMDEMNLKALDLEPIIGKKSYVSQVLNKKKPLTAQMMRMLHHKLGIPATILLV